MKILFRAKQNDSLENALLMKLENLTSSLLIISRKKLHNCPRVGNQEASLSHYSLVVGKLPVWANFLPSTSTAALGSIKTMLSQIIV